MTTDRWWDIVRMRFRSLVKRQRVESELDREMRYHLERQVEENIAAGMNAREAREAASRMFGVLVKSRRRAGICAGHNIWRIFSKTCATRCACSARVRHLPWPLF